MMEYYLYFGRPVMISVEDNLIKGYNRKTGLLEPETRDLMVKIVFLEYRDDTEQVTKDEFIQVLEARRGRDLDGDGTVFALYATINAIEDTAKGKG